MQVTTQNVIDDGSGTAEITEMDVVPNISSLDPEVPSVYFLEQDR